MADRRLLGLLLVGALAVGCSGDDGGDEVADEPSTTTTAPAPVSAVDISQVTLEPIEGGAGVPQSTDEDLPAGYVEVEYLFSGVAGTYRGAPNEPATPTGEELAFSTRILVRAPEDPAAVSGRVFVEPFNTSGGADADVVWRQIEPVLADAGDVWIGVTVRANAVVLLQEFDAERYADADVPANDAAWDILRQLGGYLKELPDASPPGGQAEQLYLGGYSQSGLDVATFLGAFADDTRMEDGTPIYDGYLPAARSASLTPLRSGTAFIPTFVYEPMGSADVPVMDLESQSDVQGFSAPALAGETYTSPGGAEVRLDDSDTYRLYEIAGMPHASGGTGSCNGPSSDFPNPYFLRAATEQLFRWAEAGEAPPEAERLEADGQQDRVWSIADDEVGNPLGGVRSPFVDVPLVAYDVAAGPGAVCMLFGTATPLADDVLAERYPSAEDYLDQFEASLDETIAAGFLREADRADLVEIAETAAEQALP